MESSGTSIYLEGTAFSEWFIGAEAWVAEVKVGAEMILDR